MTIHLASELQELIEKDVARGPYHTPEEFVEHAVRMLHEQEEWLSANRADIATQIEEGYAAAQRGELIDADAVKSQMDERKRAWQAERLRR